LEQRDRVTWGLKYSSTFHYASNSPVKNLLFFLKRRTAKSSMGFLTGGQKKTAWVVRKSGMGFLTGEQKKAF